MRRIIWAVAIIAVMTAGGYFWRLGARGSRTAVEEAGPDIEQKVLSFSIDGRSPKGVRQWHLEGNSAEIIEDDIHLNDLEAVAYGDDTVVNLSSERGVYRKDKGEVELIGDVEVVTDNGVTLTTERAKWSQVTKEISTDAIVHILREGMNAVGKGAMANADEKIAMLMEDVMVIMEPDTKVTSDGSLKVRYSDNIAVFRDNVKVEDKDGKLFADKLTVIFDPKTQKLARVEAEGNVKIKKGKSYTMSDKAIYTGSTKHAQLLGKPRVIIDPSELSKLDDMGK